MQKLRRLGWSSQHAFSQAVEKTVQWYVENEWWWRKIKSGEYWNTTGSSMDNGWQKDTIRCCYLTPGLGPSAGFLGLALAVGRL